MKKISIKLLSILLVVAYPSYTFVRGVINKNIYETLLGIFALLIVIVTNQILYGGNNEK